MNIKHAWIVFLVALVIALPVRIYQLFFLMDSEGSYFKDGGISTAVILAALALGTVLIIIMCHNDKHAPIGYRPIKNIPTAVICALTGASMIYYSIASMVDAQDNKKKAYLSILDAEASSGQLQAMQTVLSLLGIAAGLVVLITAYNFFVGANMFHNFPIIALIPPLWGCVSLAVLFVTITATVNVTENVYDMFTVVFSLLFLFAQSRLFAGVDVKKTAKSVYAFGLPGILFMLTTSIPGILLKVLGKSSTSSFLVSFHILNVCMAVYIILFLKTVSRDSDKESLHK